MKLVNQALSERPIVTNAVHDEPNRCFVVTEDFDERSGLEVRTVSLDIFLKKSILYESLSRAAIDIVDALEDAGFNAQRANESIGKHAQGFAVGILQPFLRSSPRVIQGPNVRKINLAVSFG